MKFILKSKVNKTFFEMLIHENKKSKTIIILSGFPNNNNYDEIMYELFSQGYNVFFPRYLGMYQTEGIFLEENLVEPLIEFIEFIRKGKVINFWDDSEINFQTESITILGSSFAGAIALNICSNTEINNCILFSPVIDFKKHNELGDEQDLNHMGDFVRKGFKNCIRLKEGKLNDLLKARPELSGTTKVNQSKFLIYHDPNDKSVNIRHSEKFIKNNKGELKKYLIGHGLKVELIKKYKREICEFIEKK